MPLLIGIGNPLRGDDGVGADVVRRVNAMQPPFRTRLLAGDAAELIDAWSDADRVLIVDAAKSGAPPGTIRRFDAGAGPLPATYEGVSTHGFGLVEAIELARNIGALPDSITIYAIETADMSHGAGLSPAVAAAAARLAGELSAHPDLSESTSASYTADTAV